MNKKLTAIAAIAAIALTASADHYVTPGDGTTYTPQSLSQATVTCVQAVGPHTYLITDSLTINAGDAFELGTGVDTLLLGDKVVVDFLGTASLQNATGRTLITREDAEAVPYALVIHDDTQATTLQNLDIEYVCVRAFAAQKLVMDSCSVSLHNGAVGSYALQLSYGTSLEARRSRFAYNQTSAIGGGANIQNDILLDGCTFYHNQQANKNQPQLNLTVSPSIVIRNCTITGDSTKTLSGGIAISNFMSYDAATTSAVIENCTIDSCRYGITPMGPQTMVIRNNKLQQNRFETSANNGGSAISIYDPYYKSNVMVTGNLIEGSLWGVTVIGGGTVNLGKVSVDGVALSPEADDYNPGGNTFKDNGNGGVLYDLYNNGAATVYAQGNTWNVAAQDSASIESVVWHKNDYGTLGEVVYLPCAADVAAGISQTKTATPSVATRFYTLDGQYAGSAADRLPRGLYIEQTAGGTRKVVR